MNFKFRNEDLTYLFNKYKTKKISKCIICNDSKIVSWTISKKYPASVCKNCNLVFMNKQLEENGLNDYYSNYIGKRRINNKLKMQQRKKQYLLDRNLIQKFISKGKVLDIGCNGGFFLDTFSKKFKKYGTEVDEQSVEYAKKNFSEFGKNIFLTDIINSKFQYNNFDLIIMRGVIEHVSRPAMYLNKISKYLKNNGYLYICATPNGESQAFRIYRERWNLFHPVQHLWHFSPDNLEKFCKKYNLKLIYKEFYYLGTPYENFSDDIKLIANELKNNRNKNSISPPFFENMMSLIFQKK